MMARDHDQSGISDTRFSPKLLAMERTKNIYNLLDPKLFLIGEGCKARMH